MSSANYLTFFQMSKSCIWQRRRNEKVYASVSLPDKFNGVALPMFPACQSQRFHVICLRCFINIVWSRSCVASSRVSKLPDLLDMRVHSTSPLWFGSLVSLMVCSTHKNNTMIFCLFHDITDFWLTKLRMLYGSSVFITIHILRDSQLCIHG